jgi:hypothetical protein
MFIRTGHGITDIVSWLFTLEGLKKITKTISTVSITAEIQSMNILTTAVECNCHANLLHFNKNIKLKINNILHFVLP